MKKTRVVIKNGKEKSHVRDEWIPTFWRYNGAGFEKDKKKEIPRKKKYKNKYEG